MTSFMPCRSSLNAYLRPVSNMKTTRTLGNIVQASNRGARLISGSPTSGLSTPTTPTTTPDSSQQIPNTHFKITLRRSAISLGDKIKGTLLAMGFHRRFQTVYFPHTPEMAGKILKVKELVEVENVPEHLVRTKRQQRQERKATRGYKVVGSRKDSFMKV